MKSDTHYDVIVAGGGSAGVAAAVSSSRAGARTLLIERGPCLGGAATLRNVVTYCGLYTQDKQQVVFGFADEVVTALERMGAVSEPQKFNAVARVFDPESVKFVLDDLCRDADVDVRLHSLLVGAEIEASRLKHVDVADHEGIHRFTASAYVDASGDADLAHRAGAQVRYGTDGWVQNGSLGVRFGGIGATCEVSVKSVGEAIRSAKSQGKTNLLAESGLVARMPISGDVIAYLIDEAYDARSAMGTSRAEQHARRQA